MRARDMPILSSRGPQDGAADPVCRLLVLQAVEDEAKRDHYLEAIRRLIEKGWVSQPASQTTCL